MDGLDQASVTAAITAARPEVIVHQMTALAALTDLRHFDRKLALTNRLRTEGPATCSTLRPRPGSVAL